MVVTVNDQANLSNKLIRRIKYLLYKLKEKFDQIMYGTVHVNSEGQSPRSFSLNIIVGLPGEDLIFKASEEHPESLIRKMYLKLKRLISKRLARLSS